MNRSLIFQAQNQHRTANDKERSPSINHGLDCRVHGPAATRWTAFACSAAATPSHDRQVKVRPEEPLSVVRGSVLRAVFLVQAQRTPHEVKHG